MWHLAVAADGTLYAYTNPSGTSDTLFKSTDAGYRWSTNGKVKDAIVGIATALEDARTVYYATVSHIYKSIDAGLSFTLWGQGVGGAGSNNITITSIDVTRLGSNNTIAVGTKDSDSLQYGSVYLLDESEPLTGWINTNLGNYDVLAIAFSPRFAHDR